MAIHLDTLMHASHQRDRTAAGRVFVAPLNGIAHVSGERATPLLCKTIPALFADTVRAHGERDAAVFLAQNKRFSWNELSETVDAFAAGLLSLGLKKGERIGIWSPNRWEWLVTQFATARLGLSLVNIIPA
jgi:fatty-acyl-CoA synthase